MCAEMIGESATIQDIILQDIDSIDLACHETLSSEVEQRRPTVYPYKIVTRCGQCETSICLYVGSTQIGIVTLQSQLAEDLCILCGNCGRQNFPNGRKKS
ncbi:E7 protein [Rusa timorensis papillomavirus 1]|uniref:Protein E7 n=1 Tax=Rusa timorensis papillomavirus 1 TaxID=2847277 RepID=A0A0X9KDW4_9PAPI|nr:E7 protein [Rusa timorensis papillomavirus 1]ALX18464.1 E7 protein [Rusa timorensis papillomavirus 1]